MLQRLQKSMSEKDKGFTLIELLVVIVIIGILAGIAIPVFLNQRKKGVDSSLESDLKNAATAAETYGTNTPTSTTAITLTNLTDNGFKNTDGNTITVSGSPSAGYCIKGYNGGATSAKAAGSAMTYDSTAGGLNKTGGACAAPAANGS